LIAHGDLPLKDPVLLSRVSIVHVSGIKHGSHRWISKNEEQLHRIVPALVREDMASPVSTYDIAMRNNCVYFNSTGTGSHGQHSTGTVPIYDTIVLAPQITSGYVLVHDVRQANSLVLVNEVLYLCYFSSCRDDKTKERGWSCVCALDIFLLETVAT
jgi:hypothetical protein